MMGSYSYSQRVKIVLNRMIEMAEDDVDDSEVIARSLDSMLDELLSEDFFGTEGQLDPRGDFRDGGWSLIRGIQ